jgi:hypothetical protein
MTIRIMEEGGPEGVVQSRAFGAGSRWRLAVGGWRLAQVQMRPWQVRLERKKLSFAWRSFLFWRYLMQSQSTTV